MTKNEPNLTKILTENDFAERDAIHVAVIPVICGEDYMQPGEKVKLKFNDTNIIIPLHNNNDKDYVGVISPFLFDEKYGSINKGDKVYLILKPNSVTEMRHHWKCPSVDNIKKDVGDAEKWLRNFAEEWRFDYSEMIEAATNRNQGEWGNYITAHGKDLHSVGELGEDYLIFWEKIEELTGEKFDEEHKEKVTFSCSC